MDLTSDRKEGDKVHMCSLFANTVENMRKNCDRGVKASLYCACMYLCDRSDGISGLWFRVTCHVMMTCQNQIIIREVGAAKQLI